MFGSDILDVVVGLIFVFLLVSMMCSAIREGLEAFLKTRATHLEQGIRELLHDPHAAGLAKQLFQHPLVASLYSGEYQPPKFSDWWPTALTRGRKLPAYIPSRNFALALMDMAARGPVIDAGTADPDAGALTFENVRANVASISSPVVQRAMLAALDTAQGDLQKAQANLEAWYDSSMDRVSGWYKRSTQWILFVIGLLVAVAMNVNTLTIADYLHHNKATRDALVTPGRSGREGSEFSEWDVRQMRNAKSQKRSCRSGGTRRASPVQWKWPFIANSRILLWSLVGWLITALAASLGAPFWFDILNKVMVIRSTVKPHEKSGEESSEDRQTGKDKQATSGGTTPGAPTSPPAQPIAPLTPLPAPSAGVPPLPQSTAAIDPEHLDGCDVDFNDVTTDEELPAAEGGVA